MKTFLLKGLVAGVVYFFLGWLVYGLLLENFFSSHMNPAAEAVARPDDAMIWWAMIVGCLSYGFLLGYVFARAKITTFWCHVRAGAIVGLFVGLAIDLMQYSMVDTMSLGSIWIDVIVLAAMSAIIGAIAYLIPVKAEEAQE